MLLKGANDEQSQTDVTVNVQISPDAFEDIGTNSRFGFQLITAYFMKVWLIHYFPLSFAVEALNEIEKKISDVEIKYIFASIAQ